MSVLWSLLQLVVRTILIPRQKVHRFSKVSQQRQSDTVWRLQTASPQSSHSSRKSHRSTLQRISAHARELHRESWHSTCTTPSNASQYSTVSRLLLAPHQRQPYGQSVPSTRSVSRRTCTATLDASALPSVWGAVHAGGTAIRRGSPAAGPHRPPSRQQCPRLQPLR